MKKAVIIESEPYLSRLCEIMEQAGVEIVLATQDGEEAWAGIREFAPDFLITELVMPRVDGLSLLEDLRGIDMNRTKVIVTTFIHTPDIIQQMNRFCISRFYLKPYDIPSVGEQMLRFMLEQETQLSVPDYDRSLRNLIVQHLKYLGAPMQIKGYPMLVDAIYLTVQHPEYIHAMTSVLYPKVGGHCHATAPQVERNLRHIIERIWDRCRVEIMEEYFGNSLDMNRDKPNNSEFVATISEHIRNLVY